MSPAIEKAATIDIGELREAIELIFADPVMGGSDRRYLLQLPGVDYLETLARYPKHQIKQTSEYYIEDTGGQWFACYNVDCFDPPLAIVRARSFEQAYETFCDEFERWIKVDESDATDYPEDERDYNSSGTHIDASQVQIYPLQLLQVICSRETV